VSDVIDHAYGELLAVCAAWTPPHERDASLRLLD
jgi:hypothetical protein